MRNTTLLQIFILQSITKQESSPYEIFKLIKNKGVEIKLNYVYNCLKALQKKGYAKTILKDDGNFYIISDLGIDILGKIEYINSLFLTNRTINE